MHTRRLVLLIFTVFAVLQAASAQDDQYGFYFTNHRGQVQIPFQFRSNLIIVSVCVNERDIANFIVDTGVSHSIITDALAFHPFTVTRTIAMAGVGGDSTLLASISTGNSIRLGTLRANHHAFVVLKSDVLKLSEYAGIPIHGIIGYELFANLVVKIDFQRQYMTLTQPDHYRYRPAKGEKYPIQIQDSKAYTNVLSVVNGGQPQSLRVILDTGAGHALLLDRFRGGSTLPAPGNVVQVHLGHGLNGLITGQLGRLASIYLGRNTLTNVLVSYPDSSNFGLKLANLPPRQGNIGCELLRRFQLTLHYQAGYMVLKPIKRLLREPFEHDMSGLDIRAQGDQFSHYVIARIAPESPAEKAALHVGDELVIINNRIASELTMGALNEILQAGNGKPISLIVRRASKLVSCHFLLKRII